MRGIPEDELIEVRKSLAAEGLNTDAIDALIILKVRELQPWMTLDEFLKSEFVGKCWILAENDTVHEARYSNNKFNDVAVSIYYFDHEKIKGVVPIHKPEPPR